jgi:hypothetical protein
MAVCGNIPQCLHLYVDPAPNPQATSLRELTIPGSLPVLRPVWKVLSGRAPLSRVTTSGGATTGASRAKSRSTTTWPTFSFRKQQYADIESDSTHELTQVDLPKANAQTTTTEITGPTPTIEVGNGGGRQVSWTVLDKAVIRAHTDIEVRVAKA